MLIRVSRPPPNGSRLSCGANAGGRKGAALRRKRVGEQTDDSFKNRPRQLQALVRPRLVFRMPRGASYRAA